MLKMIIGVVVVTVIVIFTFVLIDNYDTSIKETNSIVEVDNTYWSITVTGEVLKPGTYMMQENETVGDLINSAGGTKSNADSRAFIEETPLVKNVSYYIAPLYDLDDYCGDVLLEKVNINTGTKEELMSINGIGNAIAGAIIEHRNENGSFTYIEQIMEVKGIAKATFENLKDFIILR